MAQKWSVMPPQMVSHATTGPDAKIDWKALSERIS
jgi:hypothetical protein